MLTLRPPRCYSYNSTTLTIITTLSPRLSLRYLNLLKSRGTLITVGGCPDPWKLSSGALLGRGLTLKGSLIGGIRQTQEMIDFCAEHDITCDIELIPATPEAVDAAWERTLASDVKYRFVLDTAKTLCMPCA